MSGDRCCRDCVRIAVVVDGHQWAVVCCVVRWYPHRLAVPVKRATAASWPHSDYSLAVCWADRSGLFVAMLRLCQADWLSPTSPLSLSSLPFHL